MIDGLWTIDFQVPGESRSLVLVFNNGKVQGGNTEYYYDGEYEAHDHRLKGKIVAKHYHGNTDPMFMGAKEITLVFFGEVNGELAGTATETKSQLPIPFTGIKRA